MSDRKMLEDSPTQKLLRFLPKRKLNTHSVIRALIAYSVISVLRRWGPFVVSVCMLKMDTVKEAN